MGSTIIRFKNLFDIEISGHHEENFKYLKTVLDNSYISSGKQDINICNKFNSFGNLPIAFMELFSEAVKDYYIEKEYHISKHNNGEAVEYLPSYYTYPLGYFDDGDIDWLISEGDELPMWKYENGTLLKWHREMDFNRAKTIKVEYSEWVEDNDEGDGHSEKRIYNSIEDLLKFKHFYYKRWNELKGYTEWDFRKKFTTRAPKSGRLWHSSDIVYQKKMTNLQKMVKANLDIAEKTFKGRKVSAYLQTSGSNFALKITVNKRGGKHRSKIQTKTTSQKSLVSLYEQMKGKRVKRIGVDTKRRKIHNGTTSNSLFYVGKTLDLNPFVIAYAISDLYTSVLRG